MTKKVKIKHVNEYLKVPVCSVSAALAFVFVSTSPPPKIVITTVIASNEKKVTFNGHS